MEVLFVLSGKNLPIKTLHSFFVNPVSVTRGGYGYSILIRYFYSYSFVTIFASYCQTKIEMSGFYQNRNVRFSWYCFYLSFPMVINLRFMPGVIRRRFSSPPDLNLWFRGFNHSNSPAGNLFVS